MYLQTIQMEKFIYTDKNSIHGKLYSIIQGEKISLEFLMFLICLTSYCNKTPITLIQILHILENLEE